MIALRRPIVAVMVPLLASAALSGQQATFRAGIDVVAVPVWVSDRGRAVNGLAATDFQLLDNNIVQDVTLTTMAKLPVDVTLVVDTSASIMGKTLDDVKADLQQMADMLQADDRVRVVSVSSNATEVVPLRSGGSILPVDRVVGGGTTALYDGLAAALVAYPFVERPQLVFVVTDGRDTASFLDADQVVAVARDSSAVLTIALVMPPVPMNESRTIEAVDPALTEHSVVSVTSGNGSVSIVRGTGPFRGQPEVQQLRAAASATGGAFYANAASDGIPDLFRRVIDELRDAYVLSYTPKGVSSPGWHTIAVRTKNAAQTIRARSGYDGK